MKQTYEIGSPWIVYTYLTTDRRTRITGRSKIEAQCAICGDRHIFVLRIPRFGRVPEPKGGRHADRVKYVQAHQHTPYLRANRLFWARPLLNVGAPS